MSLFKRKASENTFSDFTGSAKSRSFEDRVYDAIVFVVLTLVFLIVAYPLYFIIISSISDPVLVASGQVTFWPRGITFEGYQEVFKKGEVMRGFFNSVYYTLLGVGVSLVVTLPTAYALSRDDFFGRKVISIFYVLTMFVSGGLIPTYLVVRSAGFIDTVWALVIPGAMGVYNMMVARTFFKTNISPELLDAAKIDGCNDTWFFLRIVLPLSGAIIAILVLWIGVGHWNSYFNALLYLNQRERQPLQLELRYILILNTDYVASQGMSLEAIKEQRRLEAVKEMLKYSLIIISSLPVLLLYPFIQKHFVKGVTVGSLKG
ncbi:MAG: carbohydrate ABC transporter permease [Clostridiales bacterium]|jgi:putative aldouronate transport system permease protein|nr:carbohydrate ABC transporter permease [Clostridiales bacterium]